MKREVICAQGEITVFRIEGAMPAGLSAHNEATKTGLPIISHSESGNHHVLDRRADVMEKLDAPEGMRILYALLEDGAELIQDAADAHGSHSLPAGLYEFRIAREFDPFSEQIRQVAD
jgi:hypothetical protein